MGFQGKQNRPAKCTKRKGQEVKKNKQTKNHFIKKRATFTWWLLSDCVGLLSVEFSGCSWISVKELDVCGGGDFC